MLCAVEKHSGSNQRTVKKCEFKYSPMAHKKIIRVEMISPRKLFFSFKKLNSFENFLRFWSGTDHLYFAHVSSRVQNECHNLRPEVFSTSRRIFI